MAIRPILGMVVSGWFFLGTREKWAAVGVCMASLVSSVVELAALSTTVPFVGLLINPEALNSYPLFRDLMDILPAGSPRERFLALGAGVIACLSLAFVFRITVHWLVEQFSVHLTNRVVRESLSGCLNASYLWLRSQNGPELAQRISNDAMATGQGIFPVVLEITYNLFVLVIGLGAIVVAAPWQALVVIAILGIVGLGILGFLNPLAARFAFSQRRHTIDSVRFVVDTFSARKLIKASQAEDFFLGNCMREFMASNVTRRNLNFVNKLVPSATLLLGQIGMLGMALALVLSDLPVETVVAHLTFVLLVLSRVLPATSSTMGAINKLVKAEPFFRGFVQLQDQIRRWAGPAPGEWNDQSRPLEWQRLELRDVGFRYPDSDTTQVSEVSLSLERGKSYGIVGPSGAGKSTLIDLLLGLLPPDQGEVRIDDRNLAGELNAAWLSSIAYVPQEPHILDDTVRRNVGFGLPDERIEDDGVWRALEQAQLIEVVKSWPEGLDTRLGDAGSRLSGGQRQRIAIARAMYRGANFLVLDEATNALDTIAEEAVNRTVHEIQGVTSLIVAHRISALRACDFILLMKDGQIVDIAPYDQLLNSNDLFRTLAREDVAA